MRLGDESRIADDRLEASLLATPARRSAADRGRVSELACAAAVTAVDVAAGDDAEPDTGADGHRDEIVRLAATPVETFRDRERVHVVVREHGQPEAFLEDACEGNAPPAEHRRVKLSREAVDHAGDAQAEPEQRRRRACGHDPAGEHVAEPLDRSRSRRVEGLLEPPLHVGLDVDEHADEVVRRDLDAERRRGSPDELEE